MRRLVHQRWFLLFWLSFGCFWPLVHCCYTVGTDLVGMWWLVHQRLFLQFCLSFGCFWRLVHCCYTVGTNLVDMWRLVHQCHFCCFYCILTVFDCFWRLVHCWCSLGRHVTIGTPMVIFAVLTVSWLFWPLLYQSSQVYQGLLNSVPTVYQSSKTVKNSQNTVKTAKMTTGVPIVTCLPRFYQQCTNIVPIVKNNQKQSKDSKNSKNHCWCTNRLMSTQSPPNTQSPRPRPPSASAEYTKLCSGRPSGWHDIVTCQRLVFSSFLFKFFVWFHAVD